MSEEFLTWFERFYESKPYFTKEEKEELKFHTWFAWRDSRRADDLKEVEKEIKNERKN